ncbi:MAG: IS4 family transposase [Anaerolineae bacterium]|nr:IS4 family transposase [Anaerolineae bacterium]MCB0285580.1 IS4 family transposase [Calditrichota bacterium]
MPKHFYPNSRRFDTPSFAELLKPLQAILMTVSPFKSRGNKPLEVTFEHMLKSLIFFHLEEHTSGRHLLQILQEDAFARSEIAPPDGMKNSTFFEILNNRGLEQFLSVYQALQQQASHMIPKDFKELGDLVAIDGSLIDAVLSMTWADYRDGAKKAKVHLGFDVNRAIPSKIFLTNGKADERPFVDSILQPGQTAVMDRYYQHHQNFDRWQTEGKQFVCRIKANTRKVIINNNQPQSDSIVFFDAMVLLGSEYLNQTERPIRLIGYRVKGKIYWIATNRYDLSAEQVAEIYRLRWRIEDFFKWWKQHLKVYHLISRSYHGLMIQILAGLITYLLLAIYCHNQYNEKVSIKRVRQLRIQIQNEIRNANFLGGRSPTSESIHESKPYAKT